MNKPKPVDIILNAYRDGVFPMAESADDDSFAFYKPYRRGLLSIDGLHIPSALLKALKKQPYTITINQDFAAVIDGCAAETAKRDKTWINRPIRDIFVALHDAGHAHSIECRNADGTLAGGLYGLAIGAVFCGESMFSNNTNASKIALVHLCALLRRNSYSVLDTQFINPHLLQFGAYEIDQEEYEALIKTEMEKTAFLRVPEEGFPALLEDYLTNRVKYTT